MKFLGNLRFSLAFLTLLYLGLPLVVFLVCWVKPAWSLPAVAALLYGGGHLTRAWPAEHLTFRRGEIVFALVFGLALTAFVGIGGFAPQQSDWIKHNAVLFDCIHLPWPVVIDDGTTRWPLVYYLAYYLPAAAVGKIAGYPAAQLALWAWSGLGVALACLWFARLSRLPVSLTSFAFFSFAGLDFLANLLVQALGLTNHHGRLDLYPNQAWAVMWQFPSHFWALEWAPGQALAGWLSAGMLLASPKPLRLVCLVFLCVCGLLWSPFAALGLGLLGIFLIWREGLELAGQPVAPMLSLALPFTVLAAFYATKVSPEVAVSFPKIPVAFFTRFHDAPGPFKSVLLLLLFALSQFGIFWWFIRARFPKGASERNLADAVALALLCLLPVTMGYYSDLSMRASAAPLFGLALLTMRAVGPGGLEPRLRRWFALVILIGLLTPLIEACHQAYHLAIRRYDPRTVPHQVSAVVHMADGGYAAFGGQYVGSTNSFFARTLAR